MNGWTQWSWLPTKRSQASSSTWTRRSPRSERRTAMIQLEIAQRLNRRLFLTRSGLSLGALALGTLLGRDRASAAPAESATGLPHFAPKAKRVIYLFQSGAPSQMDLFDYKPGLKD